MSYYHTDGEPYGTEGEYSDSLVNRALIALHKRISKEHPGARLNQPSNNGTGHYEVNNKWYVVLAFGHEPKDKVVYRVRNDEKLKFLRRWPSELDDRV